MSLAEAVADRVAHARGHGGARRRPLGAPDARICWDGDSVHATWQHGLATAFAVQVAFLVRSTSVVIALKDKQTGGAEMKKLVDFWHEYQLLVAQDMERIQGDFLWN